MTSDKTQTRRRYSAAMKAQVVAACDEPGASVAKVAMETAPASADIRVELGRGPVTMSITWPASAAADLAAWTRELLR